MAEIDQDHPNDSPSNPGFWGELRRRKVLRVAGAYPVVAFAVLEAGDILFEVLLLPHWSLGLVTAVRILAFPLVSALAWAFDITPDGVRRTRPGTGGDRAADRYLAGVMATGLALALIGLAYYVWSDPDRRDDASAAAAPAASDARGGTRSIDAHDAYLLGLYHWNRRSVADLRRAIEPFEQALGADPGYARAHAGVALA